MSNFSENLAMIVKNIGCDYEKIDKSYSGEQITELYLKEYEKGRKYGYTPVIKRMGLPDRFIEHGSTPQLLHLCHIDEDAIINTLSELISEPEKSQK